MKLIYLANSRIPTEKAHGAQIIKMCEAFANNSAQVVLVVPRRLNPLKDDPFLYYHVEKNFTIKKLPTTDTVALGLGYWVQLATFSLSALVFSFFNHADYFYSRDEFVLYLLSFFHKNIIWESHTGRYNFVIRRLLRVCPQIVVISQGLKDFYIQKGIDANKLLVAHDGIDLSDFGKKYDQTEVRKTLHLPLDKKIALYVGRLDGWKGVDTLCAASEFLSVGSSVAIIGGEQKEIDLLRAKYPKILFVGSRPYRDLVENLAAGDVLVLPNTGKEVISARFTSPLKLFAYMAAQKPIITSDLPSIREVLDDQSAYFVESDNPEALAKGIEEALTDSEALQRAISAYKKVEQYTWYGRAKNILIKV